jgi:hypothetical protein
MGGRLLPKRARRRLVPPVQFQIISGTPMTLGFTHHLVGERQELVGNGEPERLRGPRVHHAARRRGVVAGASRPTNCIFERAKALRH